MPINNRYPLAINYDSNGNASGLAEFEPQTTDLKDICSTAPTANQVLVYNNVERHYCPSTLPAPGEFTGNLSDVGGVCTATPEYGQVLTFSDTGGGNGVWCASTVQTGGGGGSLPTATNGGDILLADAPGVVYSASAPSDAGFVTVDHDQPPMSFSEEGEIIKYNGTELEAAFPDNVFIKVQNADSVDLNAGDAVYVTTAVHSTERLRVAKANASNSSKMPAVGVVHTNTITPGNNGLIVAFGKALINTTGMTLPTPGQVLYIDTADGQITNEKPTGGTELIQNIGILSVAAANGRMKVTGVGRANDIPNKLEVVDSVVVGDTVLSQTNAKLANVDQNVVMITDGTSAVSSLSGASGSIVYFENEPPEPGLKTFANILSNENYNISPGETYLTGIGDGAVDTAQIADGAVTSDKLATSINNEIAANTAKVTNATHTGQVTGSTALTIADDVVDPDNLADTGITNGQLIKRSSATQFAGVTTTANSETFLGTNANLKDLTDVDAGDDPAADQDILQLRGSTWSAVTLEEAQEYQGTAGLKLGNLVNVESGVDDTIPEKTQPQVQSLIYDTTTSSYTVSTLNHHNLSGLGDDDHTQYVLADGTRTVTGTLSVKQDSTSLDTLYLESAEDSSNAAPIITMQRDSTSPAGGDYLGQIKFSGKNSNNGDELYAKITGKTSDVTLGTEDGLIEVAVKNAGSNLITTRFTGTALKLINGNGLEVDGTLDVTGATTLATGSVTATPTTANHIANKSYVDSQIPTASYLQAIASGSIASVADEALTLIGWATTGTYALTDPAGNLEVDSGEESSDSSIINVSGAGVYQVDATVRVSNTTERLGLVFRIYRDPGDGTFVDIPELRTSNYASRGTGSGEGITNGSASINALLNLDQGDRLRFYVQPKTGGTSSTIQQEGTYLRITKVN